MNSNSSGTSCRSALRISTFFFILFNFSCQPHASCGRCRCSGGYGGGIDRLLISFDVELQGRSVRAHVDGDRSTHNQWQIDVVMTRWKSAEHWNVILCQQVVEHSLNTYDFAVFVCELSAAADEFTETQLTNSPRMTPLQRSNTPCIFSKRI